MTPCYQSIIVALALGIAIGTACGQTGAQAPPATGKPISPEALEALVAPIALYPDALIIQIVQCAGSPFQVKQVNTWLKQNPDLKGTAAQDAAAKQGFDASFIAIVLFPQVLQMMADKPDWTRDLGQAFTTQRDAVLESVQQLRQQALKLGNLKTNEQQKVENVTVESGQQVIVIQPANPQVVYVPQYNPQVVYVQAAPPPSQTNVAAATIIGFAAGVIVGAAADDDDHHYYHNYGGWGYARPICYSGGYQNYYQHRENMAKDYYQHRENMASQRGQNQGQRQDSRNESQGQRQDSRNDNQTQRQGQQDQNQASRSDNQSTRQTSRSDNQTSRQTSGAGQVQAPSQANRASSATGGAQGFSRPTTNSASGSGGAFSGIQSGSTERASSARGQSSVSGSSRGSGGGGGGKRR